MVMNDLVETKDLILYLQRVQKHVGDIIANAEPYVVGEEWDVIDESCNVIINTAVAVEQQLRRRDELIDELYKNSLDISINLEAYMDATHNYSGMSDEDRYIYDDIDKAEDERRRLAKLVGNMVMK
jgi:hypothetical protein